MVGPDPFVCIQCPTAPGTEHLGKMLVGDRVVCALIQSLSDLIKILWLNWSAEPRLDVINGATNDQIVLLVVHKFVIRRLNDVHWVSIRENIRLPESDDTICVQCNWIAYKGIVQHPHSYSGQVLICGNIVQSCFHFGSSRGCCCMEVALNLCVGVSDANILVEG